MFALDISLSVWLIASAILLIGTVVQGCIGFGGNLLAVPVVVIVEPDMVPGAMLVPAFFLSCLVLAREREHTDWRGAGIAVLGRVPGAILGALVLVMVSADALSILFGGLILLAVALTASAPAINRSVRTLFGAGLAAGFMATTVAVGGPPIALVYQDGEGPMVRTTLSAFLAGGTVVSVIVLAIVGEFTIADLGLGLAMLPATFAGLAISGPMRSRVDGGRTRTGVLILSSIAAIIAIARGVM